MKIVIASDHRALLKKDLVCKYVRSLGYEIEDLGPYTDESADYPVYAKKVCDKITKNNVDLGILFCGTGIGMSIAANKFKGIRCGKVNTVEEAKLIRLHNNSNVIALSSKTSNYKVKRIIKAFIETSFSNEKRHVRRVEMLEND